MSHTILGYTRELGVALWLTALLSSASHAGLGVSDCELRGPCSKQGLGYPHRSAAGVIEFREFRAYVYA